MDLSSKARQLIHDQINHWDLARRNYEGLKSVKTKSFDFGYHHVDIQFNPERIASSAAKVDAKSIEARPCFLCRKSLPIQQKGITIDNQFIVLVNPFPIFLEHLTIPSLKHTAQRISGNVGNMLDLAAKLHEFTIFYNGPKCGASAPDHMHFQAGIKGFLPIEKDYLNDKCCHRIRNIGGVVISHWPDYQRGILTLNSKSKWALISCFTQFYKQLQNMQPESEEPMLNILASYSHQEWVLHIFPRILHRPKEYFETGEKQILLSPASVDMGGVLITPREEDFNKISETDVKSIFDQVCLNPQTILKMIYQF
jgi:ATP adenylyltransferase/5',5'''-P-1,P-4-tetraphosphate phosphorylase II